MKMDLFLVISGVRLIPGNINGCCQLHVNCNYLSCEHVLFSILNFRFSYLSICCLSLLKRLDKINVEKAVDYIVSCKNMDGGFGSIPGGESHAGQGTLYYESHCCHFLANYHSSSAKFE